MNGTSTTENATSVEKKYFPSTQKINPIKSTNKIFGGVINLIHFNTEKNSTSVVRFSNNGKNSALPFPEPQYTTPTAKTQNIQTTLEKIKTAISLLGHYSMKILFTAIEPQNVNKSVTAMTR